MKNTRPSVFLTLFLALTLLATPAAFALESEPFEYLVVSYGETRFSNPLLSADSADAAFSKVQLFSEIGITIPSEAISLQRNIDVLGQFGWEMVTVVGAIGGDQQIVFKRPYDAERSIAEAQRIKTERDELMALYNASRSNTPTTGEEKPKLIDIDAVEREKATEARNKHDADKTRRLIEAAGASGFPLSNLTTTGIAISPDGSGIVSVQVTQDVTAAALISPGQYRRSLVVDAVDQFRAALTNAGFVTSRFRSCLGTSTPHTASISITAIIKHDDTTTNVGTFNDTHCFNN